MKREINILDATIRDGGYVNNYGFSSKDVENIVLGLEECGLKFIEIGHGYGIGAEREFGKMAQTDEEYLKHMRGKLTSAKLGMFANVNIATKDDLKKAHFYGLDFVRVGFIGFNKPHPLSDALLLIEYAKKLGFWVSVNMVKSNMYTHKDLNKIISDLKPLGINCLYVVDSPGGMLPKVASEFVSHIKQVCDIPVGFHAHQNFTIGVANSLAAVEAGADFVDGTLLGIGRDSGNAQIDVLAAVLEEAGYETGLDTWKLGETAQSFVQPLLPYPRGVTKDNLTLGYYGLLIAHTLPLVKEISKEFKIPEDRILSEMQRQRVQFEDEEVIRNIAKSIKE